MTKTVYYRGADKSLARPTSRCILLDGENISFDVSLLIHINSNNIPPIIFLWNVIPVVRVKLIYVESSQ